MFCDNILVYLVKWWQFHMYFNIWIKIWKELTKPINLDHFKHKHKQEVPTLRNEVNQRKGRATEKMSLLFHPIAHPPLIGNSLTQLWGVAPTPISAERQSSKESCAKVYGHICHICHTPHTWHQKSYNLYRQKARDCQAVTTTTINCVMYGGLL